MAGPRKPPAPSRPPSTAPLPRGSSLANSTAATAPPRSPPPCCARSITPFRLKSGSAHHLVGYFTRPDIFRLVRPTNRSAAQRISAFSIVGIFPICLPTCEVGPFVVDGPRRAWFAVGRFLRPSQAAPQARHAQVGAKRRGVKPMNAQDLLQEIADYCRHSGLAVSTFGRRAVNDGKLTARLRNGGRITTETLDRIRSFMEMNRASATRPAVIERLRETLPPATQLPTGQRDPQRNFRFFDNRQKYLLFVS